MIFVDTWAWVALADRSDPYHARATVEHQRLQASRERYVTSDYVLGETITYLYDALPVVQAEGFLQALLGATKDGFYQLTHISPDRFQQAWELRKKYNDKPDISFVDFTSFVVMREMGIRDVFTGDAHFEQVGFGFRRVP